MNRHTGIIVGVIVLVLIAGGVVYVKNAGTTTTPSPTATSTVPQTPTETTPSWVHEYIPTYTAEGKLDTSDWVEYKSNYGGFSVKAPKYVASIGCGHGCDPKSDGESFDYVLIPGEGSIPGMSIRIIKKKEGTSLDTWVKGYVVSGGNQIISVQKVSVGTYSALQFDLPLKVDEKELIIKSAAYPLGGEYEHTIENGDAYTIRKYTPLRFLIVDLPDRYALVSYTLSPDNKALFETLTAHGYTGPFTPKILDNEVLTEIYDAILGSFRAFTPTIAVRAENTAPRVVAESDALLRDEPPHGPPPVPDSIMNPPVTKVTEPSPDETITVIPQKMPE